jgi:cytoskeletal protein CcmA (bactofilin family)
MSDNKKADVVINGNGTSPGGDYNNVKINGCGKIEGDVTCVEFVINGSGKATGSVQSKLVVVSGTGHILGDVKTDELKARGAATFSKDVSCKSASVSGASTFSKNLDASNIRVSGSIKVDGDCSADDFSSTGLFQVGGLLSADTIEIRLGLVKSTAGEIGGEKITIRTTPGRAKVRSFFGADRPLLETDSIEGNEITLESTRAKVVRGHNVNIGSGCDIDLVEYTGVLKKASDAKVGEEKKV